MKLLIFRGFQKENRSEDKRNIETEDARDEQVGFAVILRGIVEGFGPARRPEEQGDQREQSKKKENEPDDEVGGLIRPLQGAKIGQHEERDRGDGKGGEKHDGEH